MPLFPQVGRTQPHLRLAWWSVIAVLCTGVALHLLPFYFMISSSLKTGLETLADPPTFWPQHVSFSAWQLVFQIASNGGGDPAYSQILDQPFSVYFFNSLIIVFLVLILSLPITSLAAYATSKLLRGPVARWSFLYFIGTLMVPIAVTLLPSLLLTLNFPFAVTDASVPVIPGSDTPFPTIRIWDTPWAVIIPSVFNAFNYLLFKGFFDTLPNSVIQAARVDGGSEFNIFRRIVLPMSIPVYAVATWLQFSGTWDNFLWPSLVLRSPEKSTTALAIYNFMNKFQQLSLTDASQAGGSSQAIRQALESGLTWNGMMVLGILQTIPIFLVFLVCREYLLKGVHLRGLK